MSESTRPTLLLVDDEPVNLKVLRKMLADDYNLIFAKSGEEAIQIADQERPDLILLDIMMPGMSGFDTCEKLKRSESTRLIPVLFTTALDDEQDEALGFKVGAVDYITKPLSSCIVKARVKTHLSLVQADELKRTRLQIIQRLGRAAEYKDNETGMHVVRMSHYSRILALSHGLDQELVEIIFLAAPMHDVGKIGISDKIMLKPGKLTQEEFEIMKTHSKIGAEIIGEADSDLLRAAKSVALTHHEKWDGSGYPAGLKGNQIPIEGRIVAVADVFDALTSKRPYKEAWSVDEAIAYIEEQKGKHFEPALVESFIQCLPEIIKIKEKHKEI